MRHLHGLFVASCLGLFAACGNDSGDDDALESSSSGGPSAGGSSGAVSQTDGGSAGDAATAGTLTLRVAGQSYVLVLADLAKSTFKDTPVVTLSTIWDAAGLNAPYTDYVFDFVGADGFRPASRDRCKTVVFDGAAFARGYVELESQRLTWDDELGYSGCAFVSNLATIEASTP